MLKLTPEQEAGAAWLCERGRAILADPAGFGKTAQAIAAADRAGSQTILVVAPKTLLHNWAWEIGRWSTGKVEIVTTRSPLSPSARWHLTNYEVLTRRDLMPLWADTLIVDEAHRAKNRKAKRTRALFRLARRAKRVWLLTGTPILNRPDELWPLLHMVDHERYRSYWRWVDEHCLQETVIAGGRPVATKVTGVLDPERLRQEVGPYVLMRDISLLNLPERLAQTVRLVMSPAQRRLYRQMRRTYMADLGSEVLVAANAVTRLVRLQQLALDPRLVGADVRGVKTDAVLEFILDHPAEQVLIFTTFRTYANLLADELDRAGVQSVRVTGAQTPRERQAAVEAYQRGNVPVLIGTYGAMGEGLNLQATDIVVHMNLPWVPAMVEQAEARALRRGRNAPVSVLSYVVEGTVDEAVEDVLRSKLELIDVVALYKAALSVSEQG